MTSYKQLAIQNVVEGVYDGRNYALHYVNFILMATIFYKPSEA